MAQCAKGMAGLTIAMAVMAARAGTLAVAAPWGRGWGGGRSGGGDLVRALGATRLYSADSGAGQRFWTKTVDVDFDFAAPSSSGIVPDLTRENVAAVVDFLKESLRSGMLSLPKADHAVIMIPQHQLIVPMHDDMIQPHLTSISSTLVETREMPQGKLRLVVCGFGSRAQGSASEPQSRPVNPERRAALDAALQKLGSVTGDDLVAEAYRGTPPSRMYRSFACPHPRAVFTLEPLQRAAERAASQIDLAVRQMRADQAEYLRNVDRLGTGAEVPISEGIVHPIKLVLDNIRSAFNVGSIFRTAETGGVSEVITCGITAHPPNPKLQKTALHAADIVPTRHFDSVTEAIAELKRDGYKIVVMETTSVSNVYTDVSYPEKIAVVLGNEVTGVDTRVIEQADIVAEIPTFGLKNSLNVASVAPIMVFEVIRQWNSRPKPL